MEIGSDTQTKRIPISRLAVFQDVTLPLQDKHTLNRTCCGVKRNVMDDITHVLKVLPLGDLRLFFSVCIHGGDRTGEGVSVEAIAGTLLFLGMR